MAQCRCLSLSLHVKSNDYGSTSYYSFFQHGLVMLAFSGGASSEILVRLKVYIFWGFIFSSDLEK